VAPQSREAAGPSVPAAAPPEASSPDTDYDATALEGYFSAVRARIEAAKRYPPWARRQGIEGRVTVAFRLTVGGDLAEARVQGSSGSAVLDQAAVEAVRRGAPYPRRPQAGPEELEVTLVFALR
jgi:protein TonB